MDTGNDSNPAQRRIDRAAAAAQPAIWDLDVATGAFTATPSLHDLLGKPAGALTSIATLVEATFFADRGWYDELTRPETILATRTFRLRIVRGDGAIRWMLMKVDVEHAGSGGRATSYTGIVEDITDAFETASALSESEERLQLAVEAGRMAVWEVDLDTGSLAQSVELNLLLGFPADATISLADVRALYLPGELERIANEGATWETIKTRADHGQSPALRSRGAAPAAADRMQIQSEVAITTPQGELKHLLLRAQHAESPHGGERVTGLLIDITERKRSEERLGVVARELQHRVKNSLAVVQMLAGQSLRGATDVEAATQAFMGRLRAFAAASDLILNADAEAAPLHVIVDAIVRPYRGGALDPFEISGEPVGLAGRTATALGMVLHELCTNAVKYGALSTPAGRVKLSWRLEGELLTIDWQEEGGPAVQPPARRGFGSRLLDTVLAGEPNGKVETSYAPPGLRCRLELSLR
jgi:two-component sensor histidine kinase